MKRRIIVLLFVRPRFMFVRPIMPGLVFNPKYSTATTFHFFFTFYNSFWRFAMCGFLFLNLFWGAMGAFSVHEIKHSKLILPFLLSYFFNIFVAFFKRYNIVFIPFYNLFGFTWSFIFFFGVDVFRHSPMKFLFG